MAGLRKQTRGLRDEFVRMKALVPNVADEDVKALTRPVESLGEQLPDRAGQPDAEDRAHRQALEVAAEAASGGGRRTGSGGSRDPGALGRCGRWDERLEGHRLEPPQHRDRRVHQVGRRAGTGRGLRGERTYSVGGGAKPLHQCTDGKGEPVTCYRADTWREPEETAFGTAGFRYGTGRKLGRPEMRAMVLAVVGALLVVGQVEAGGFGRSIGGMSGENGFQQKAFEAVQGAVENPRNVPGWLEQVHLRYEMDRPEGRRCGNEIVSVEDGGLVTLADSLFRTGPKQGKFRSVVVHSDTDLSSIARAAKPTDGQPKVLEAYFDSLGIKVTAGYRGFETALYRGNPYYTLPEPVSCKEDDKRLVCRCLRNDPNIRCFDGMRFHDFRQVPRGGLSKHLAGG